MDALRQPPVTPGKTARPAPVLTTPRRRATPPWDETTLPNPTETVNYLVMAIMLPDVHRVPESQKPSRSVDAQQQDAVVVGVDHPQVGRPRNHRLGLVVPVGGTATLAIAEHAKRAVIAVELQDSVVIFVS